MSGLEQHLADENAAWILGIAAQRLVLVPFAAVTLDQISSDAGLAAGRVELSFPTMRSIGSGILDHERESMRIVRENAFAASSTPLARLVHVFRSVGENLANDIVVRAGVRIAGESRHFFPERRLDPFRTWASFVTTQLTEARNRGDLRAGVNISETVEAVLAAGMRVKDLISFHDAWHEAPERFETVVTELLSPLTQAQQKLRGFSGRKE
ncbi:hypothetical protein E3T35_09110 [Cryobacterium sp. TMT1-2-2]|uniref:hypothetical protein n=1 Tax=Cryobacterium sp. TMT1-2-2 TaxID=1259233 RepID=UPI00106D8B63|nr:hypothetical protein [Cryobacterium sp. TMT1-2-2]TFD11650.1 hypothetical protein E3T35_09110 [Cryobacterium sp. TMT1-2-2]